MKDIYFTVDNFLEDTKEGMPLEEQLRILLDKMDVANASRKPGVLTCIFH